MAEETKFCKRCNEYVPFQQLTGAWECRLCYFIYKDETAK